MRGGETFAKHIFLPSRGFNPDVSDYQKEGATSNTTKTFAIEDDHGQSGGAKVGAAFGFAVVLV
ncbi:hypothetical protein [Maribacter sp. 2307ULW6-5]|uniref:hypothetical protein n=1 Tax=Maribacter sp. 2307ULW6-5 TaxID=3386275 RepID=UPI0039BC8681